MSIEHHDLVHEFPEHKARIHQLKVENAHFAKLFDQYHDLTKRIEALEGQGIPVTDETIVEMKKQRVRLKDELYALLISA